MEDRVRTTVLRRYAEGGHAPTVAALASALRLTVDEVRVQLAHLEQRDLIVVSEGGDRILGAYPFTDRVTGHRVGVNGGVVNAMCAVDALGIGAMLGRDTRVDSRCLHSGAAIQITTRDHGRRLAAVRPETAVVWLALGCDGGPAAFSVCTRTAFFQSAADLDAWHTEADCAAQCGVRLSPVEALEAGRAIFEPSLRVNAAADPMGPD
jgi:mercuric reductase